MTTKKDLIGQRFGRLVVCDDAGRTKTSGVIWKCQCDCGSIVSVVAGSLQSGHTQSCGCLQKAWVSKLNYTNLIGQRFSRLLVLDEAERKNGRVSWRCQCDCGNIVDVVSSHLQSGHTNSCGCYNKDQISKTQKKDLTGQKFGRLTVLEDVGRRSGEVLWRCACDCGNITNVIAYNLQGGNTQSCGCYSKERTSKSRKIDLIGQKFGRLHVLEEGGRDKLGDILWACQCECGNKCNVTGERLRSGATQSCGCYNKERLTEALKIDLIGRKFNRLTVLEDVGRKNNRVLWKCQCDCGNIVNVVSDSLQSGNTQSCGCYHKERISETTSRELHYNWKGGIAPLYEAIRACTQYRNWRTTVVTRDRYTCQYCGDSRGGNLHAHHIIFFSTIMEAHNISTLKEAAACEILWDISNGLTLCQACHKQAHYMKT